jgi:hypothetical protein
MKRWEGEMSTLDPQTVAEALGDINPFTYASEPGTGDRWLSEDGNALIEKLGNKITLFASRSRH